MDKILRTGTILAFAFGLFFLGRSLVNPLDVFLISLALFYLLKNPDSSIPFFKGNRKYYLFALSFLFSISLSIFGASDKFEVLKNLIQFSAYTLLIPLTFAIKRDIVEDIKSTFTLISIIFLLYSFLLFCIPKPVRLSAFEIHPNALGFIFSLFAVLNLRNLPLFLFFSFMSSLTFSRASLLGLFISVLVFSFLEKRPKFALFAFLPLLLSFSMPNFIQIYKSSSVCEFINKKTLPSAPATDINLVRIYDLDRVRLIEASLKMFSKNPITGVGLGNFNVVVREMCKKGELNNAQCSAAMPQRDAHNFIFGFLAETGIVGLLSLIIFFGFLIRILISSGDKLGISVFTLSIFMSLLHPPVFFTRFMGPLVWYIILKGKLKIPSYEGSGKV
ncbi:MAG: O-antigen ligase family protein [Candidatus Caldipriscus sp.]